jgi:hypothetical protein
LRNEDFSVRGTIDVSKNDDKTILIRISGAKAMFESWGAVDPSEKAEKALEGGQLSPHLVIGRI